MSYLFANSEDRVSRNEAHVRQDMGPFMLAQEALIVVQSMHSPHTWSQY